MYYTIARSGIPERGFFFQKRRNKPSVRGFSWWNDGAQFTSISSDGKKILSDINPSYFKSTREIIGKIKKITQITLVDRFEYGVHGEVLVFQEKYKDKEGNIG